MSNEQKLREAVFIVLEGFTLDYNVRKILEAAYYRPEAIATTEPEFNQEPFIGDPVLVVEREPDYWDRGHFHEGTKPDIKCTKIWSVPIGTKLYTEDQMKSYGEQCWKAGYDLGKSRSE